MRQYYTYFDYTAQTIGFSPAVTPPTLIPTTQTSVNIAWVVISTLVVAVAFLTFLVSWIVIESK